ncbi:hypothetical protein C8R43DRAFT_962778 [Mycena crocata]|nr:hypothetical protein C8R43DRAFT_962778 [Mycena crocata]
MHPPSTLGAPTQHSLGAPTNAWSAHATFPGCTHELLVHPPSTLGAPTQHSLGAPTNAWERPRNIPWVHPRTPGSAHLWVHPRTSGSALRSSGCTHVPLGAPSVALGAPTVPLGAPTVPLGAPTNVSNVWVHPTPFLGHLGPLSTIDTFRRLSVPLCPECIPDTHHLNGTLPRTLMVRNDYDVVPDFKDDAPGALYVNARRRPRPSGRYRSGRRNYLAALAAFRALQVKVGHTKKLPRRVKEYRRCESGSQEIVWYGYFHAEKRMHAERPSPQRPQTTGYYPIRGICAGARCSSDHKEYFPMSLIRSFSRLYRIMREEMSIANEPDLKFVTTTSTSGLSENPVVPTAFTFLLDDFLIVRNPLRYSLLPPVYNFL